LFFFIEQINTCLQNNITTKWKQNGTTIAGGKGKGDQLDQLFYPCGIRVDDDDQCIYIADYENDRIVKWKYNETIGQVVAGGNRRGNRTDRLDRPTDMIVDKRNDSLIICDVWNGRVVRWPRQNGTNGQTIISDIACGGLATDNNGDLYVSDWGKNEVRRWKIGETNGTIVAGGNGKGIGLNQFNTYRSIFVDQNHSVYVSDAHNYRVMKWMKNATKGIVVAGGQGKGNSSTQLSSPGGVIADYLGHVYVVDTGNQRVMRWCKGAKEGMIVVGGNGYGEQPNQLYAPTGLSFDREGNLYVGDWQNNRVQKFEIE
jgi:sugar lactone lactonase YvrE